jgi:protein-disulfide isomerase
MQRKRGWLAVLAVVALLVAACGPPIVTPTARDNAAVGASPTTDPGVQSPKATPESNSTGPQGKEPTKEPIPPGDLPVAKDDWHVLGSPDAPVTMVEYSDFQ